MSATPTSPVAGAGRPTPASAPSLGMAGVPTGAARPAPDLPEVSVRLARPPHHADREQRPLVLARLTSTCPTYRRRAGPSDRGAPSLLQCLWLNCSA
jgi:hypothetical protein